LIGYESPRLGIREIRATVTDDQVVGFTHRHLISGGISFVTILAAVVILEEFYPFVDACFCGGNLFEKVGS
jgi:hypothetical protein